MAFGKREQVVVGVVVALVLIAALHFMIFAPSANSLKEAKDARTQMAEKVEKMRVVKDPTVLVNFQKQTDSLLLALDKGLKSLQLDENEAFIVPAKIDDFKLDKNPGEADDAFGQRKQAAFDATVKEKQGQQADLLLGEVDKLLSLMGNPADPNQPQTSFLSTTQPPAQAPNCWRMPAALSDTMQGPELWNQLARIADIKLALDKMVSTNANNTPNANYAAMNNQYNQALRTLGMDPQLPNRLKRFGEFVPLYYRLAFADLILKRLKAEPRPPVIAGAPLDRDMLFTVLKIELPTKTLEGLKETRVYFAYEELRNLNQLLEMSKKLGVVDVTGVELRGYAFLREQQLLPAPDKKKIPQTLAALANDEEDDLSIFDESMKEAAKQGAPMPGMFPGMGMMPMPMPQGGGGASEGDDKSGGDKSGGEGGSAPAPAAPMPMMGPMMMFPGMRMNAAASQAAEKAKTTPRDKEIGYALPIKLTYRATSANASNYIYEVLRAKPLAEIHRWFMKSLAAKDPTNPNVETTATFLIVPKLLDTLEKVQQDLKDIQAGKTKPTTDTKTAEAAPAR